MSEIEQSALDSVRALQRPGAPDLLGRIIAVFLDQTPESVQSICDACLSGDLETVRASAHALKSSAAYVGAIKFSTRMGNIEGAARDNDLLLCRDLVVDLTDHSRRVLDELQAVQDKAA